MASLGGLYFLIHSHILKYLLRFFHVLIRIQKMEEYFSKHGMFLITWSLELTFRSNINSINTFTESWASQVAQWCRRCRRQGFDFWVRKISWRRKWQPIPVFLPGKFQGQRTGGAGGGWLQSMGSQRVGYTECWACMGVNHRKHGKNKPGRRRMGKGQQQERWHHLIKAMEISREGFQSS